MYSLYTCLTETLNGYGDQLKKYDKRIKRVNRKTALLAIVGAVYVCAIDKCIKEQNSKINILTKEIEELKQKGE